MQLQINPIKYHKYNVVDTCSVWNILSSNTLYSAAKFNNCSFCCTKYVNYECLIRQRSNESEIEKELQKKLIDEKRKKIQFIDYDLTIEDLQDVEILENRKRLGKGELSSIVFAKKTRQAFMTDDQSARKLAGAVMDKTMIQTTPHLFGWLFYINGLFDSDKNKIIKEHSHFRTTQWGNLSKFFDIMYQRALELRLMNISKNDHSQNIDNTCEGKKMPTHEDMED